MTTEDRAEEIAEAGVEESVERRLPPTWPTLSKATYQGTTNTYKIQTVMGLQCLLNHWNSSLSLYIDGDFGSVTESAVKSFQTANGLYVDGIAGPITLSALIVDVQYGSVNSAVKGAQNLLFKYVSSYMTIDGYFGTETLDATKSFQSSMGIIVDGYIGPQTWQPLFGYNV